MKIRNLNNSYIMLHAAKIAVAIFIIIAVLGFSSTKYNKESLINEARIKSNYNVPVPANLILSETKLSLNDLPKNELINNLFTVVSIKNNTHNNEKGLLMEPVLAQFKNSFNSLHIISSFIGTSARGNHKHDVSEVLVLMRGYWHLRVLNSNPQALVHDFTFDNGEPVAIVIEPHICHALRNSGTEDDAWAAAYYLNGNNSNKPITDKCLLMD